MAFIEWSDVQNCLENLDSSWPLHVDDTELFDEIRRVRKFLVSEKLAEWREQQVKPAAKWMEVLSHFTKVNIPYSQILNIVEFFFSSPGTNACVERSFSMMNDIWTTDKQFSLENVRSAVTLKYNQQDVSCTHLHTKLLSTLRLLKDINSSKTYEF